MSLKKFILHRIIPLPDIDSFDSYVFVAPHPDDAEVGAGATMAKLAEQGKRITLIIATDARYGSESADYDREALALKRREEQEASSRLLGIQETVFLPFTDGGLYDERDLVKALVKEFTRLKPQAIFCPDPLLHTECHADHLKVGRAALSAALMSGNAPIARDIAGETPATVAMIAMYYTDEPNKYFATGKKYLELQQAAMRLHSSQFVFSDDKKGSGDMIMLYNKFRSLRFGLRTLKGHADGFRVLAPAHTHCCAEKI